MALTWADMVGDSRQLRAFARDQAWGHHASGACDIDTDDDPNAVLDSRLEHLDPTLRQHPVPAVVT